MAGSGRVRPGSFDVGLTRFVSWNVDLAGRLSIPVQRRLPEAMVDDLVDAYLAGSSIDALAAGLEVNRTTIINHLDSRGIERRKSVRKMTDRSVRQTAKHCASGVSLVVVAARVDVDEQTLAREFKRAGVRIRSRRGSKHQTESNSAIRLRAAADLRGHEV